MVRSWNFVQEKTRTNASISDLYIDYDGNKDTLTKTYRLHQQCITSGIVGKKGLKINKSPSRDKLHPRNLHETSKELSVPLSVGLGPCRIERPSMCRSDQLQNERKKHYFWASIT